MLFHERNKKKQKDFQMGTVRIQLEKEEIRKKKFNYSYGEIGVVQ
jgi:hypothetical protein